MPGKGCGDALSESAQPEDLIMRLDCRFVVGLQEPDPAETAAKGGRRKKAAPPECMLCKQPADKVWLMCGCGCRTHTECLARHFLGPRRGAAAVESGLPTSGNCPQCGKGYSWQEALGLQQSVGWVHNKQKKKR